MNRFRVVREAQRDLDEIWLYIAGDNLRAADELLGELRRAFLLLVQEPMAGQSREDLIPALRFLPVRNYLIFYLPLTDGVEILRVIHGARNYSPEDF
jgi:toxin ParE1/3/4